MPRVYNPGGGVADGTQVLGTDHRPGHHHPHLRPESACRAGRRSGQGDAGISGGHEAGGGLAGAMLGSVVADSVAQFTYLAPLGRSVVFGVDPPVTLDLRVVTLTLGLTVRLNLATVLGIILAIYLFRVL